MAAEAEAEAEAEPAEAPQKIKEALELLARLEQHQVLVELEGRVDPRPFLHSVTQVPLVALVALGRQVVQAVQVTPVQ